MLDQNEKPGMVALGASKLVMGKNIWPNGIGGIWKSRDNPEALFRVVNDGDDLIGYWGNGPVFA